MEKARIARFSRKLSASLRARWLRRSIDRALVLSRYEVRSDFLSVEKLTFRLAISWRARGIHPWDGDLAPDRKARRLVQQTFTDTLAVLDRLFTALPEVDVIDLKVQEQDARKHGTLFRGSISRREFETARQSSPLMKLRELGVSYNLANWRLEPLAPSNSEHELPDSEMNAGPWDRSFESAHPGGRGKGAPHEWHQDKARPH